DPDRVQHVLDVNIMGTVRTVHALFGLVHSSGGRVVLLGSETGPQHGMPMNGPYAMSKHAVEAYADSLRREPMFLGIDVVLVPPGSLFAAMASVMGDWAAGEDERASDPALLAEAVWTAGTAARPRPRYRVRWNLARMLLDLLPVTLVDRALRRALGRPIATRQLELEQAVADAEAGMNEVSR